MAGEFRVEWAEQPLRRILPHTVGLAHASHGDDGRGAHGRVMPTAAMAAASREVEDLCSENIGKGRFHPAKDLMAAYADQETEQV